MRGIGAALRRRLGLWELGDDGFGCGTVLKALNRLANEVDG